MVVVTHPGVGSVGLWCSCGSPRVGRVVPRVQIAERRAGRDVVLEHVGTARSEGELAVLLAEARRRLRSGQGAFDLEGVGLVEGHGLLPRPGVITGKLSAVLWRVLSSVYDALGFAVVGDEAFKQLVLAAAATDPSPDRRPRTPRRRHPHPNSGLNPQRPQPATSVTHPGGTSRDGHGRRWAPLARPPLGRAQARRVGGGRRTQRSASAAARLRGATRRRRSGPAQKRPSAEAAQRRLSRARASRRCRQRNLGWRAQRPQS